ncbi:unnamed protein product, partial [Nesidiocoris tenuis]
MRNGSTAIRRLALLQFEFIFGRRGAPSATSPADGPVLRYRAIFVRLPDFRNFPSWSPVNGRSKGGKKLL